MKLRVQKFKFDLSLILKFFVIIEYHFFYLFSYNALMSLFFEKAENIIIAISALAMFVFVYLKYSKTIIKWYGSWMFWYSLSLIASFSVLFLISELLYQNQRLTDTLSGNVSFLYPLLMSVFALVFINDNGTEKMARFLNFVCFIWYILMIMHSINYSQNGTVLFSAIDMFETGRISKRENNLRMSSGLFGNVMVVYNFVKFYCRKNNEKFPIFNLILFVLGLYCAVVIQQTRAMIIVLSGCIAVVVLFFCGTLKQNIIKALSIIGIVIYLGMDNNIFAKLISTFSNPDYQITMTARTYAYAYYFEIFKNSPLYGFAFCADKNIIHGPLDIAYTSDVGFVGLMATTGLFSIVIYIVPILHMIKLMLKKGYRNLIENDIMLLALMTYLVLTSATLLITHAKLCYAFPFIIALFEYTCRDNARANDLSVK
ncbi:hypothetical protein [uncultured Acetatifactor sp.]|uniref:hypothetical protein n=1 Tax=uncultured Acetatifactor sp. TaxID=1671927 RepID=UPI00262723EC|nr:hypothetical protein [uncultured Acetatifactor sp.]